MVPTREQAEFMLFPRLLAVAERAWHAAGWETVSDVVQFVDARHEDWLRFAAGVAQRELRRLDLLGVNYRLPRPGVRYAFPLIISQTYAGTDGGVLYNNNNNNNTKFM